LKTRFQIIVYSIRYVFKIVISDKNDTRLKIDIEWIDDINLKDIPDAINYYLKSSFQLDNDVIEHWVANN
jgi:hypothetical protein